MLSHCHSLFGPGFHFIFISFYFILYSLYTVIPSAKAAFDMVLTWWSNLRPASIVMPRSFTLADGHTVVTFISMHIFIITFGTEEHHLEFRWIGHQPVCFILTLDIDPRPVSVSVYILKFYTYNSNMLLYKQNT